MKIYLTARIFFIFNPKSSGIVDLICKYSDISSILVRELFGKKAFFRGIPERFPKDTRTK
ncbi:hypothetical protein FCL53_09015 [Elizabethkingia meningoseptica]|nr:hypothetical protein [Elizabethkingia meningoseptica]